MISPFKREEVLKSNLRLYDSTARRYDAEHKDNIWCEKNRERIKNILGLITEDARRDRRVIRLLDVGCGTGNILRASENMADSRIGCDLSIECLKAASRYTKELICTDGSALPFKGESVDILTDYSVLHHLFDYTEFLKEAYRVIAKGGWLYTDFDHNNLMFSKMRARAKKKISSAFHFLKSVKRLIKKGDDHREVTDYMIANFHNEFGGGINPMHLKNILRETGFRRISIYAYDSNTYIPHAGAIGILRYPYFYCIAKK
ncbi:MAG: class I SAM-dependent methyltransferase [Candidatus Omnitrophota bacterium]